MRRIWAFYAAVFLSAFLLFQIQLITSKALLPFFGGSYLVWGASMVFYQGMLLLGYAYAHAAQKWLGVLRYAPLHWAAIIAPLAFFPVNPGDLPVLNGNFPLALAVFCILLRAVGPAVVSLSTTSLVLQRWLSYTELKERDNPYVLYGASNLGSILALLTYPIALEPAFSLRTQSNIWCGGYLLLLALHAFCMPNRRQSHADDTEHLTPNTERRTPNTERRAPNTEHLTWFLLSLSGCAMLLAVTNVITFDVASVPFLWVMPLTVYLLCFVLTFKRKPWRPEWMRTFLYWIVLLGILLRIMSQLRLALPVPFSIPLHLLILFAVCLNCNGALIMRKPQDPNHLTTFYLILALGGLAGSVLISWIMPLVSASLIEYPFALFVAMSAVAFGETMPGQTAFKRGDRLLWVIPSLLAAAAVTILPLAVRQASAPGRDNAVVMLVVSAVPVALILRWAARRPWIFAVVLLAITVAGGWTEELSVGAKAVKRLRNFYGIYTVYDKNNLRYLQHGTTQHGRQYINGPNRETPLAYFHPTTPAAEVLLSNEFEFSKIGMIGLGTGALAAYAGQGQSFAIYELDPDNLSVAELNFTYLDIARRNGADLTFVFGDGRIALRQAPCASLDLLIIDAFNSGSIPVHLLTVEAFQEYFNVLKPGGLLLLHVSNKILDLVPVVYRNARELKLGACEKSNEGRKHPDAENTYWMALSRDHAVVEVLTTKIGWLSERDGDRRPRPWTDQYSNIFGVMFHERMK